MAKYTFGYRCPECAGKFVWPREEAPPDRCPSCHRWMSTKEPDFEPKAPAIRKGTYSKSVDQTYRAMEEQSILRAEEAAGILEDTYRAMPKDEHATALLAKTQKEEIAELRSELKITNMKDPAEMREGDTAAITRPSSGIVTQPGFQPYAGGSGTGGMTNFAKTFTSGHTQRAVGMIRAGNMGKG